MASLLDKGNLRKSKDISSKGKKEVLSLNQLLKKHKSQEVYFKPNAVSKEKNSRYILTEKNQPHSKKLFNKAKISTVSPRLISPKQKMITKSNKISPRETEKKIPSKNIHLKQGSLEKIMSDNDSCEEIESDEEGHANVNPSGSAAAPPQVVKEDETEVSELNNEFYPTHPTSTKSNQVQTNIKYHINKFPTLASNPFTSTESTTPISVNVDLDDEEESEVIEIRNDDDFENSNEEETNSSEQLYRSLLNLSKKGDKESFLETLEKILSIKGDINYQNETGYSAIHYACEEGNLKIVEILIKANCDVNIKTNDKKTPLHLAAANGYFDISKLLIENGAIINIGDSEKNTPLHLCCQKGHAELTKFLLDKVAQADTKNIYGKTPLSLATKTEIKELLRDYLSKKSNAYRNIKIHTASESTVNYMIKKFNSSSQNKIMFQNTQNNININIQTNINNGCPTRKHNASLGKSLPKSSNSNNNSAFIPKKKSIPNFTLNSQLSNRKNFPTATSANFHKTKTLQKFLTHSNSNKKKEQSQKKQNHNAIINKINITNISVDQNDPMYRLNKTEELSKPYSTNPNETSGDNIYNQLSLNSIEEERVTPTSFVCLAMLGKGSFGEVYLVQKITTKILYAMKVLSKDRIMGQNLMKYAMAERNVLSLTNHPFIVKLNFAFQTTHKLFLILDYCPGGDLAKHLQYEKRFTEDRARFYLCEVLLALEDLHKRDIIFRDLKPDNVVLDEEGHAKLTDFGLSKEGVFDSQSAKSFCGSIAYLAPEMLKKQGHGKAVDWYLLGVLFYEMLVGIPPYFTDQK